MTKINYKSDFDFILRLHNANGDEIGFPDYDWEAKLSTGIRADSLTVSCIGGVCTNCYNDNDLIHVVADNHRLAPGFLTVEFRSLLPNENYPDGARTLAIIEDTEIELVRFSNEPATAAEVELVLPYIKGEKGDPFTYSDFTSAQIAVLQQPALEAAATAGAAAETAALAAAAADRIAVAASEAAIAAETAAQAADEAAENANQTAQSAATAATAANNSAQTANSAATAAINATTAANTAAETAKLQFFIDIWNTICGSYGKYDPTNAPDANHPFLLNGLYLTYAEALKSYKAYSRSSNQEEVCANSSVRTNIPIYTQWSGSYARFAEFCSTIEVAIIPRVQDGSLMYAFYGCKNLKRCEIRTISSSTGTPPSVIGTFTNCSSLETLVINGLSTSLNLSTSPLLTSDSFINIIQNRSGTGTIVLTVHPDIYAKLTDRDNDEWSGVAEDALARNIQFATV